MTAEIPLVSIIIVNYNGESLLKKCLGSIKNNNYKNYEIILLDNHSTDDSVKFIETNYPEVSIIKLDKNYGFAEPNNIGAKQAKGDLFFFLNNDTIINENSISELVKFIQQSDASICQSLLLKPDGSIDSSGDFITTGGITFSSKKNETKIIPILSARGAAMMVKKEVFWELNGFDKQFFASFEDVDFGWRAWLLGHKVVLVPQSIVYHHGGKTSSTLNYMKFHGTKNTLVLCFVNFEFWNFIRSLFLLLRTILVKRDFNQNELLDYQVSFNPPSFMTTMKALSWIIKHLKYVLKKRKRVNSRRRISTKKLIRMGLIKKI